MSYCINPRCAQRQNPEGEDYCLACGSALVIQGRYRLLRPLRELDEWEPTEIFEVADLKSGIRSHGPAQNVGAEPLRHRDNRDNKVLKVLKKPILLPLFEREATTLQQLDHPGIPQVASDAYFPVVLAEREQPLHCLVMENIQGSDLDAWLQAHGPIDQATALGWLGQLVDLLAQLHAASLFHRDIKLSNIMLRPTGQLALIDFGTVRPLNNTYFAKIASQRDITSVMSPGYTPLEQINGKAVPQSDFYALGRSLVYLLTGQHPLDLPEDETTGQLIWQDKLPQPLSPGFAQLLDEMMAPFPGQRPLNAQLLEGRLATVERQFGLQADRQAKLKPNLQADLQAELRADSQAEPQLGLQSDLQQPAASQVAERSAQLRPGRRPQLRRWAIAVNLALLFIQIAIAGQWLAARQRADQPAQVSNLAQP